MSEVPNGITKAKFKLQWTHGLSEKLCKLYKAEESLYNINHDDYHNRDARCAAWARITSVLGVSSNASKKRIDSMRTQYVKYLRDQTGRAGKPWFADKIQFLKVYIKGRARDDMGDDVSCEKDEPAEQSFNEDSASDTARSIKNECNNITDSVLMEYGEDDSAGGGDEEEEEDGEESMDNTHAFSPNVSVQRTSYPREINRSPIKMNSNSSRNVGNSSRINSSTDMVGCKSTKLVKNAAMAASRILNTSSSPPEDVHEIFGRYIASELRAHNGSVQILATCKREIFMAISRMHEADDS